MSYLADPEGLLSSRAGTARTYHYVSGHGDVVQQADASGNLTYATPRAYDEFGIPLDTTTPTPYGYTGRFQRETSPATGVVRMGVRLYDPVLGRFTSRDPIEDGDLNAYLYAGGDPVNGYDLDGRMCWTPKCLARKAWGGAKAVGRGVAGGARWAGRTA